MTLFKIHLPPPFHISQTTLPHPPFSPPHFLSLPTSPTPNRPKPSPSLHLLSALAPYAPTSLSRIRLHVRHCGFPKVGARVLNREEEPNFDASTELEEDLAPEGAVYQNTLRLVECSMFAAVAGLLYFLSNSLSIENYFGCFFALPIVISSMRWGVSAGRKTMVATVMLLLVLSGPVKALTYMLMHGLVGLTMGTLWRLRANWGLSIFLCTCVRAMGATGSVLITSFLIRENILALITINIHASLTYVINALGIYTVPSMNAIYAIFAILLMMNCAAFVFLLHILYAMLFIRLGMKASLTLSKWLEKAM